MGFLPPGWVRNGPRIRCGGRLKSLAPLTGLRFVGFMVSLIVSLESKWLAPKEFFSWVLPCEHLGECLIFFSYSKKTIWVNIYHHGTIDIAIFAVQLSGSTKKIRLKVRVED